MKFTMWRMNSTLMNFATKNLLYPLHTRFFQEFRMQNSLWILDKNLVCNGAFMNQVEEFRNRMTSKAFEIIYVNKKSLHYSFGLWASLFY